MAIGAAAGIYYLIGNPDEYNLPGQLRFSKGQELVREQVERILKWLWHNDESPNRDKLVELVCEALGVLKKL